MAPLLRPRRLSILNCNTTSIRQVEQVLAQSVINGVKSSYLLAKLIEQYCKLSPPHGMCYAHRIVKHFDQPDVFLLNTLIRCVHPRDSVILFRNWVSLSKLAFDEFTYIFALGACARLPSLSKLWEGKQMHARMSKCGFLLFNWVQTTALYFYASNKEVDSARVLFDEMFVRSSVTWNAMITGYCTQTERRTLHSRDALLLFRDMLVDVDGAKPTDTTMVCVLSAAAHLGVLETGTCLHGYTEKTMHHPEDDVYLGTGLVDLYSKCGCLDIALSIFERMQKKNVLTWTAVMTGQAIHGKGKEALEFLDAMEASAIKPNSVTFTSLLYACCHSGLIEEGLYLFHIMWKKFNITPHMRHYGCIVDLLGRGGRLKEGYDFIMSMPVEPDTVLWRSLFSACRNHGDTLMAEKVGKHLLELQFCQSSVGITCEDYIALSNVYASAERWEDVEMVRRDMKYKGIETKAGCSLVSFL